MSSWRECKLGDVADYIARGISPKYSESNGTIVINQKCIRDGKINYEFSKINDFSKRVSDEKFLKKYDSLVNSTGVGTLGRVGLYDLENDKCTVDSHVMIVRASEDVDKKWMFYNLFSRQDEIELLGEGSTGQIELSRLRLADLDISLPPLEEQKAIAEVLSSLDDKINLLHRQNQTLESLSQTLFRQWFIEEIKEDWEVGTVGDIAILKSGKSRPKEESEINNIPIYGGNGILGFTHQYNVDGETIIIGRVGAYCGSLYIENKPIWVSDNALIAKPQNPLYSKYLFYILKENELNSMAEGSSHPLLTQEPIKSIEIFIPPESKLIEFNKQVNTWYEKINKNKKQIQTLENLRDALLPKFLSGEVKL